jgi:hypothetical protein
MTTSTGSGHVLAPTPSSQEERAQRVAEPKSLEILSSNEKLVVPRAALEEHIVATRTLATSMKPLWARFDGAVVAVGRAHRWLADAEQPVVAPIAQRDLVALTLKQYEAELVALDRQVPEGPSVAAAAGCPIRLKAEMGVVFSEVTASRFVGNAQVTAVQSHMQLLLSSLGSISASTQAQAGDGVAAPPGVVALPIAVTEEVPVEQDPGGAIAPLAASEVVTARYRLRA